MRTTITILDNDHAAHEEFGFSSSHYKVSEGAGKVQVQVMNKIGKASKVRVSTLDGEAKAGSDYHKLNQII